MRSYFLFISMIVVLFAADAFAAAPVRPGLGKGTGCDPEYWDAMAWRSWMEAEHDMEAAQRIIVKPQSVLDISCFDGKLVTLQEAADDLFGDYTETPNDLFSCLTCDTGVTGAICMEIYDDYEPTIGSECGPDPPGDIDNYNLDEMLDRLIRAGYSTYIKNFEPANLCGQMNKIWETAKCSTFNTTSFITFDKSVTTAPQAATPIANACGAEIRAKWKKAVQGGGAFPLPAVPAAYGGMDRTQTFLKLLTSDEPFNAAGCKGLTAIPTGLRIPVGGGEFKDDAVCPAPGCSYDISTATDTSPGKCMPGLSGK